MKEIIFDHVAYYASYAAEVIRRPGYPARAAFKSTLMWQLYGDVIRSDLREIKNYADIGGCFGFGANSMVFQISKHQSFKPKAMVFEIGNDFIKIGEILFPEIEFIGVEFDKYDTKDTYFDLITLFDVLEHVVSPESLLQSVAVRSKYVMLKTPMETRGEWRGNDHKGARGAEHPDGHINFFDPASYERLLNSCGLEIVGRVLVRSIVFPGAEMALIPESYPLPKVRDCRSFKLFIRLILEKLDIIPWHLRRKILGGGDHLCLCKSKVRP